jgi:hypothetical protein
MATKDPKKEIVASLNQLVHVGALDPEMVLAISKIVSAEFDSWRDEIVSEITQKIIDWESVMVNGENENFYSLGLRRAVDLISGHSAFENLPVLEKPDTPNE